MAAGDAQVNPIRELSGQELPLGDPDEVIGPTGLSTGPRWDNNGWNPRVPVHPQAVLESPEIFDAFQSVGHLLLTLLFPRPLNPENSSSSYLPMGARQRAPTESEALLGDRPVAPTTRNPQWLHSAFVFPCPLHLTPLFFHSGFRIPHF
jgi:hypothetical protein